MQRRTVLLIRSNECGWADLRLALREMEDVHVVGEATDTPRGVELAILHRPDVIIATAESEGPPLLPLLFDLHRIGSSKSKIIVLASRLSPDEFVAIDDVHAMGYLLWSDLSSETLRHCLIAIIRGDFVVTSRAVAKAMIATQHSASQAPQTPARLTPRERAVLSRLAHGDSHREIAAAERIGLRTVERTIASLERKLRAPTPFLLGMKAAHHGLIDR